MKRNALRFHYGNSWLMAALVAFLLLCIIALLRGAEPPIYFTTFQPVPPPSKGFLLMPAGAVSTLQPNWQGPLILQEPYRPPTNELRTVIFDIQYGGEWDGKHYYTWSLDWDAGCTLETSTDMKTWFVIQDANDTWASHNIVGYFIVEDSDRTRYFRAVPK